MKSELSFLLELALDDAIPKEVKSRVVARIRDVERNYTQVTEVHKITPRKPNYQVSTTTIQAPSMERIMEQNPDLIQKTPTPVTPQAAEALAYRQRLLAGAAKEKPEGGRTAPRKA